MTDWVKTSLTFDQIREIKNQILNNAPYTARASLGFVVRILMVRQELGEDHMILHEIANLESERTASATKPAEQFKKSPLHPFWHKHFSAPRHMIRNISVRWALDRNGNDDLSQLIDETARKFGDQPALWPKYLTHRLVVGGYQERIDARRMTGDWIVFAKHDGHNFYLDIATHEEGRDPDTLMKKLRQGSEAEFPFLFA